MCIQNAKLINHDSLPISMMLYIMLHIMPAYLMLFAALSNAACLHEASFFLLLIFANAFCFMLCHSCLTFLQHLIQLIILSLYTVYILTLYLLILSFNGFHLI